MLANSPLLIVNDTDGQCVVMATDGPSTASKRTSWIASLFGSSSSSSQESEETDGAKKQEHGNKEEHITVPAKGKCAILCTGNKTVKKYYY